MINEKKIPVKGREHTSPTKTKEHGEEKDSTSTIINSRIPKQTLQSNNKNWANRNSACIFKHHLELTSRRTSSMIIGKHTIKDHIYLEILFSQANLLLLPNLLCSRVTYGT